MKNVLLVNPKCNATFWSFKHALRFASGKAACPPLGLLTMAGMLPENWNIRLLDMNLKKLRDRDLENADLVMVGAMMIQRISATEVLEKCRNMGRKVVAGGPLFTSNPQDFTGLADYLVLNEAEITLPPFLEDFKQGVPKPVYTSDQFADLAETPLPRWDLIRPQDYQTLMVQYSRGCPFNCEFCDITNLFGRVPRVKSSEQLLSELEAVYSLGWRGQLFFVDDNFIGNKREVRKVLKDLVVWTEERGHPFNLLTEASVNLADDDELIELMVRSGFDSVFVGLETPNEESLRECGKKQNCHRDLMGAIKKIQRSGMQVLGGYIVGFDNDDESIFSRQIKFIQESGVVTAMVGLLNAAPNTRLWNRLKSENRLLPGATGDNTDGTINFIPRMEKDVLVKGYRQIMRTIYSPRFFYQRVSKFLEEYKPRYRRKFNARELKGFLKSLFFLGVLGNGASQWYYWKMMVKAALFYRNSFAEAMTLMVYGYHFRRVARQV
ncbi:MAG: DUF4070 domain-containing protein [Acidobacteriota bacterium]